MIFPFFDEVQTEPCDEERKESQFQQKMEDLIVMLHMLSAVLSFIFVLSVTQFLLSHNFTPVISHYHFGSLQRL